MGIGGQKAGVSREERGIVLFDKRAAEVNFSGLAPVSRRFGTKTATAEKRFYGKNRRSKIGSGILLQCS